MNDVGYELNDFNLPECEYIRNSNRNCKCPEDIMRRYGCFCAAIEYHEKEQNPKQQEFFKSALAHFLKCAEKVLCDSDSKFNLWFKKYGDSDVCLSYEVFQAMDKADKEG